MNSESGLAMCQGGAEQQAGGRDVADLEPGRAGGRHRDVGSRRRLAVSTLVADRVARCAVTGTVYLPPEQ
jgi:hypothetical protein